MSNLDGLGYNGKTVVVTGGASGMGEATARILGELGAKVHIVDIQQPRVPHESFHQCDLSDFAQVRATAATLGAVAPIDFVFPCAGLPGKKSWGLGPGARCRDARSIARSACALAASGGIGTARSCVAR